MADLDVCEVLRDPLFTSPVDLISRREVIDADGNPAWMDSDVVSILAVVTADTKAIRRLPESLYREGSISVRFPAADAPDFGSAGYDCVVWRDRRFTILSCVDNSQFAEGVIHLICAPEEVTNGRY